LAERGSQAFTLRYLVPSARNIKIPQNDTAGAIFFERRCKRRHSVQFDGSVWTNPNGNRNVGYLWEDANKRNLNLNWLGNDWNANYRFLAVCKFL
jgi:hypothetical protein